MAQGTGAPAASLHSGAEHDEQIVAVHLIELDLGGFTHALATGCLPRKRNPPRLNLGLGAWILMDARFKKRNQARTEILNWGVYLTQVATRSCMKGLHLLLPVGV